MLLIQWCIILVSYCGAIPTVMWKKKLNTNIFSPELRTKEDNCGLGFVCMLLDEEVLKKNKITQKFDDLGKV